MKIKIFNWKNELLYDYDKTSKSTIVHKDINDFPIKFVYDDSNIFFRDSNFNRLTSIEFNNLVDQKKKLALFKEDVKVVLGENK